jgi:hypothetical protein
MAFSDFSTILGRQFLIGFMAPALAALFLLSQLLSDSWLPHEYHTATSATQVVIVGALAVFLALLLSGMQYPLLRLLEGYPFARLKNVRLIGRVYKWRLSHWQEEFDSLTKALEKPPGPERTRAAQRLHRSLPANRKSVLPTEFGNVVRSFETHPRNRYFIDGVTIWPRIQMLLSEQERQQFEDATTDVMFFVNSQVLVVPTGSLLAINAAVGALTVVSAVVRCGVILLATAVVCALAWRASIGAARRWGSPVRAAFDLHRLELYDRLGVKAPTTIEEDGEVGRAVSRLLLYAEPIPKDCRKPVTTEEDDDARRPG